MAQIGMNEILRGAVADAVAFSTKAESSTRTRNRILLSMREGSVAVCSAGTAGESYVRKLSYGYTGPDADAVINGSALDHVTGSAGPDAVLELNEDGLTLTDPRGHSKLFPLSGEETAVFRDLLKHTGSAPEREPDAVLPLSRLRAGIKEVLYARSSAAVSGSYASCGVTLSCSADRLEVWAVDKARAARSGCACKTLRSCRCVIPPDMAAFLAAGRWSGLREDCPCRLYLSEKRFTVNAGEVTLSSPTVPGNIFDFEKALCRRGELSSFTFRTADMTSILSGILSVSGQDGKDGKRAMALSIAEGGLLVRFQNSAGEISRLVSAEMRLSRCDAAARPECRIGIDPRLFRDSLNALPGSQVTLTTDMTSAGKCIVLRPSADGGEDHTHILLPVRLRNARANDK